MASLLDPLTYAEIACEVLLANVVLSDIIYSSLYPQLEHEEDAGQWEEVHGWQPAPLGTSAWVKMPLGSINRGSASGPQGGRRSCPRCRPSPRWRRRIHTVVMPALLTLGGTVLALFLTSPALYGAACHKTAPRPVQHALLTP